MFNSRDTEMKLSSMKQDDVNNVCNPNDKMNKRYDYISELNQFKTKCNQCKALIQRIRSAMSERSDINANQIRSLCQHCKRANLTGSCKRCELMSNRCYCNRVKQYEERQISIEAWLRKVSALLEAILESNIICGHKVHQKGLLIDEFDILLKELDIALPMFESEEIESSRIYRHNLITQTKSMLKFFLIRLRTQHANSRYSSDDSLYVSSALTTTSDAYKHLKDKEKYDGSHKPLTANKFNTMVDLGSKKTEEEIYKIKKVSSYIGWTEGIKDYGTKESSDKNKTSSKKTLIIGAKRDSSTDRRLGAEFKSVVGLEYQSDTKKNRKEEEKTSPHYDDEKKLKSTRNSFSMHLPSTKESISKKGAAIQAKSEPRNEELLGAKVKSIVGTKGKPGKEVSTEEPLNAKIKSVVGTKGKPGREFSSAEPIIAKAKSVVGTRGKPGREFSTEESISPKVKSVTATKGKPGREFRSEEPIIAKAKSIVGTKGKPGREFINEESISANVKSVVGTKEKLAKKLKTEEPKSPKFKSLVSTKGKPEKDFSVAEKPLSAKVKSVVGIKEKHGIKKSLKGETEHISSSSAPSNYNPKTKEKPGIQKSLKREGGSKRVASSENISSGRAISNSNPKLSENISNKKTNIPNTHEENKQKKTKVSSSNRLSRSKNGAIIEVKRDPSTEGLLGTKVKSEVGKKGKSRIKKGLKEEVDIKILASFEDIISKIPSNTFEKMVKTKKQISNMNEGKKKKGIKDSSSKRLSSTMESKSKKRAITEHEGKSSGDGKKNINKKNDRRTTLDKIMLNLNLDEKMKKKAEKDKLPQDKLNPPNFKFPKINDLPIPKIMEFIETDESSQSIIELCIERAVGPTEMIKHMKIVPLKSHYKHEKKVPDEPLLDKNVPLYYHPTNTEIASDPVPVDEMKEKNKNRFDRVFLKYNLSNREFIDNGWTKLPTTKVMKRMNIYKMIPANHNNGWFSRHSGKEIMFYNTGEKLAEVNSSTRGSWYYKYGSLALDYYPAKEVNAGQRVVIYSNACKEDGDVEKPLPVTVLASFDSLGNGVVYDHYGNIRLKYNQSEGIIIDDKIGPPGPWKWHMLNDPPVLEPVFIDTYTKDRDPRLEKLLISENIKHRDENSEGIKNEEKDQEMITIELDNFMKEKAHKMFRRFKPFEIKMKAFKVNDQFSLRILDQTNIYLLFCDGPITMKLNLGMLIISNEIIDTETADASQVTTPYDKHPPRSRSMADIQEMLKRARKRGKVKSVASKLTISTV